MISRTGSRPPAVSGRAVKVTPSEADRYDSNAVLYASDAATVIWYRPRASSDRHFPSVPWTFEETATWVCRLGSPARESQCWNAAAVSPFVSTWAIPPVPVRV